MSKLYTITIKDSLFSCVLFPAVHVTATAALHPLLLRTWSATATVCQHSRKESCSKAVCQLWGQQIIVRSSAMHWPGDANSFTRESTEIHVLTLQCHCYASSSAQPAAFSCAKRFAPVPQAKAMSVCNWTLLLELSPCTPIETITLLGIPPRLISRIFIDFRRSLLLPCSEYFSILWQQVSSIRSE
jgi:hypothetical protein